jgi:hypothetical protein
MLLRTGRTFTLRRATRARRGLCGHAWVSSRDAWGQYPRRRGPVACSRGSARSGRSCFTTPPEGRRVRGASRSCLERERDPLLDQGRREKARGGSDPAWVP